MSYKKCIPNTNWSAMTTELQGTLNIIQEMLAQDQGADEMWNKSKQNLEPSITTRILH